MRLEINTKSNREAVNGGRHGHTLFVLFSLDNGPGCSFHFNQLEAIKESSPDTQEKCITLVKF